MSDAKIILPGDLLILICCCCLQVKRAHFLMIHTIALLSAVHLDLEFISSSAKLGKHIFNMLSVSLSCSVTLPWSLCPYVCLRVIQQENHRYGRYFRSFLFSTTVGHSTILSTLWGQEARCRWEIVEMTNHAYL